MFLYNLGAIGSWLLFRSFGHVTVIGRKGVPRTGGMLLVANHTSYVDPPLLGYSMPRSVCYMAKAELFDVPVLGPLLKRVKVFPVKRGVVDRQALQTAHKLLTSGEVVAMFIEGGRSADGMLQPPTIGAAMIALRAGVPILPAAIVNADSLLPRDRKWFCRANVKVVFGTPMSFDHLRDKHADRAVLTDVSESVMREIAALMIANGAGDRVPDGYLEHPMQYVK